MTQVLEDLARELAPILAQQQAVQYGIGAKHAASGTPISVGYSHGPGGLLTFPGVDPAVFHTVMGNRSMLDNIPATPSNYTNPTFMTITGVLGDTGNEKTAVCDNAPVAGLMKGCLVTSVFGRYERATPELELNRLGQMNDRADPMDLQLIGSPIGNSGVFASGPQNPASPADLLVNEVSRKFWERNVSIHRQLSRELWTGDPSAANQTAGFKHLTGFSILVNTGYVDAETNQNCPAIDAYLSNFNYRRLDIVGNGTLAVSRITDQYYQVKDRATRTGMMPVRWVFVMRPQLFYELTNIWPCSYLTYRCQTQGNERVTINAADQVAMRDELRAGKYLLIDGERVDVIVDDGIPEVNASTNANVPAGCFATDVYLIPMSVVGGRAVTYLEYFQYNNPSLQDALGQMILGRIEGAFLTWPRQTNQCVVWQTKIEPRLVLRTPWLASRLQNVVYCPVQHERDAFPGDPYFTNGGKTSRAGPSLFSIWGST